MTSARSSSINRCLWEMTRSVQSGRLYAVLDGARNEEIAPQIADSGVESACLLTGNITEELAAAAPYLVRLELNSAFMELLTQQGWGDNWGIYCVSTADFKTLLKHFRGCIKAQTEDGEVLFFRFFDPRVLRVYLPTCTIEELSAVFGPVERFVIEDEEPTAALSYARERAGLSTRTYPLV